MVGDAGKGLSTSTIIRNPMQEQITLPTWKQSEMPSLASAISMCFTSALVSTYLGRSMLQKIKHASMGCIYVKDTVRRQYTQMLPVLTLLVLLVP